MGNAFYIVSTIVVIAILHILCNLVHQVINVLDEAE